MKLSLFFLGKKTKVDFLKMEEKNKSSKKIVVAIDIGTKFSGFAFSLKDDWLEVYNTTWVCGMLITPKLPTCLLLKKDLSESFFGFEAENKYTRMTAQNRHQSYFFFQHFGKILHEEVCLVLLYLSFNILPSHTFSLNKCLSD